MRDAVIQLPTGAAGAMASAGGAGGVKHPVLLKGAVGRNAGRGSVGVPGSAQLSRSSESVVGFHHGHTASGAAGVGVAISGVNGKAVYCKSNQGHGAVAFAKPCNVTFWYAMQMVITIFGG